MSRVVVIGGGIAGLACAALLAQEGHEVRLFEARDELGGRAGSWTRDGFRFDTGPSWYLMPEVFDHFFRLLGTSAAEQFDLAPLSPAYRVYSEGTEAFDVHSGTEEAAALFERIEPGAGTRLRSYLRSARDAYELATSRFLYDPYASLRGLTDPRILRRLPTLLPLLMRPLSRHIDARFRDPRLRQVLGYPAVFLGGSPYAVPSLYHLMSHLDLGDRVGYPQGGFTVLIERIAALAADRGARLETGTRVVSICTDAEDAVSGVRVRHRDGREEVVAADQVVSAGDLHRTDSELLPERLRDRSRRWWRRRTPSPGALLLMLGVRGELPQLAHHTLLFREDWRGGFDEIFGRDARLPDPASLYICRPSASDDTVAPPGHENLFVLVPIPADPTLGAGGVDGNGDARVEAAADAAIAQIASWCDVPDLAERIVVRRTVSPTDFANDLGSWRGNALGLSHTLAQSAMFRSRNASKRVRGLFFAGADVLPGIGLPMCLISAELVLKRVRGDDSSGPVAEPVLARDGV